MLLRTWEAALASRGVTWGLMPAFLRDWAAFVLGFSV